MLNQVKNFPEDSSYSTELQSDQKLTRSFMNFCEQMETVFEIKDFLLTLQGQIPKKFKTGELLLLYESKQLGLRRAYVRSGVFYEQEAKNKWSPVNEINLCSTQQSSYFAEEFGRPFSKGLIIPFSHTKWDTKALLFLEMRQWGKLAETLTDFFKERIFILNLIFKRALLNTSFIRISYLWSQLFSHWWEPLAILKNFQIIRSNDSFKKNLFDSPNFIKQKNFSGLFEVGEKIYKSHYYPMSLFKSSNPTGILYCQDMTKYFHLKEQLFQSEKMASLCELGKNVAHQLNNPLTGIRAMAQILCQKPDLAEFKEDFVEVEKSIKRSQKIIENLLSFSQTQGEQQTCNLNQAVKDTLPLLKSITRDLLVKMKLCKQPLEITGDLAILQQVVYNLVLNACQALKGDQLGKKTEACIQISTKENSQGQACLKIRDNGPGIAEQNLEKIFQPLWTNKKGSLGTGFGLGIARKFIRKYKGDISVSSKEGEFTCFTVLLPLPGSKFSNHTNFV